MTPTQRCPTAPTQYNHSDHSVACALCADFMVSDQELADVQLGRMWRSITQATGLGR